MFTLLSSHLCIELRSGHVLIDVTWNDIRPPGEDEIASHFSEALTSSCFNRKRKLEESDAVTKDTQAVMPAKKRPRNNSDSFFKDREYSNIALYTNESRLGNVMTFYMDYIRKGGNVNDQKDVFEVFESAGKGIAVKLCKGKFFPKGSFVVSLGGA